MWFNQYPYINVNDLNLDFLLKAIREMKYEVENFVSINAIKYADPIQWDITRQYEKNTVVIDPLTGTAYLSVAPVPSGVALTREEYWTVIFDLGQFITKAAENFTDKIEDETTTTASFPLIVGDWLVWGEVLYKVISPIVAGDQYVVGSNIEHFTMEDLYHEYLTTVGNLADLATTDKTSIVNAVNEVDGFCDGLSLRVGELSDLNTTDKTSIVNAVNEVDGFCDGLSLRVGELSDLNTTDKTSIVNAINEVNTINNRLSLFDGEIVCVGDSFATSNPNWIDMLAGLTNNTIHKIAVAATGFVGNIATTWNDMINTIASDPSVDPSKVRLVIFGGGSNDVAKTGLTAAMNATFANVRSKFPKAMIMNVFMEMYPYTMLNVTTTYNEELNVCYSFGAIMADISTAIKTTYGAVMSDKMHPTAIGQDVIAGQIYNLICGNKVQIMKPAIGITSTILVSAVNDWAKLFCYTLLSVPFTTDAATLLDGNNSFELPVTNSNYYGLLERDNGAYNVKNVVGYVQYGANYELADIGVSLTEGKLVFRPRAISSGTYVTIPANTTGHIEIENFSIEFPAAYL